MISARGILLISLSVFVFLKYIEADCRRKEMDFDLYCKILCNPCKNECQEPCVANLTQADCDSTEALALTLHGLCNRIRQVDACDIAAACCRTDLRPCAVSLYNSVQGKK